MCWRSRKYPVGKMPGGSLSGWLPPSTVPGAPGGTRKANLWALGAVLYEAVSRASAFEIPGTDSGDAEGAGTADAYPQLTSSPPPAQRRQLQIELPTPPKWRRVGSQVRRPSIGRRSDYEEANGDAFGGRGSARPTLWLARSLARPRDRGDPASLGHQHSGPQADL